MAILLSINKAQELREKLIQYAVNTKDYTVMGTYEKILQARMINLSIASSQSTCIN